MVLAALNPKTAKAQGVANAQVHGVIIDPSGSVVPNASVSVKQTDTGMVRTTTSNSQGTYIFPSLPVGPYTLTVQKAGFRTYTQSGIVLQVSNNVAIDVRLKVGAVSAHVTVNANASMVQTQSTSVSQVISHNRLVSLPLNGRQATSLILLAGAAANSPVGGDFVSSKNYPSSADITVAGGQGNGNVYMLDGASYNDAMTDVNLPYPFPDALQEFSVQTTGLSGRYGIRPGAVVNVVTKSGTNHFHGDLFEFVRNGDFNARNYFAPRQDTLRRNQFGGTIGGPILRNKLFFFGGYQGTRTRTSPPQTISFVPTPAVLNGDFSALESPQCQSNGQAATLINPQTGQPFANNYIDPSLFNQQSLNLLKYIPTSSNPCGELIYGIPTAQDENQFITREDWTVSPKQSMFVRYFITDYNQPAVFDGKNLLTTTQAGYSDRVQSVVIGDTYSISSNVMNSFHIAWNRLRDHRGAPPNDINLADIGVNVTQANQHFIQLGVSNFFDVGCGTCATGYFNRNSFQLSDDVDIIRGRNHISFGADWIHSQFNNVNLFQGNGDPSFNGEFTGSALADFMLGLTSSFSQGSPQQLYLRRNYFGLYAQDNVRLNSRFNFHVGLRWEPFLPLYNAKPWQTHFSMADFKAGIVSKQFVNAPAGLLFAKDGVSNYYNASYADLEPRVGFVWDPSGNGKQTIRASYSIFYNNPETFYADRATNQPPWANNISITSPSGGFTNPYAGYPGGNPFPLPSPPLSTFTFPPEGIYVNFPLNLLPTYMQQWDLSLERQFTNNWMVSATYIGNRTVHLWGGTEENPAVYSPTVCALFTAGCTRANTDQRRVLSLLNPTQGQKVSTMALTWDGASASYNALLLSARHRFSKHYTLLLNYTYSHNLDNTDFNGELSGPTIQNPANPNADYGNSGFDLRNNFVASVVTTSPKFSNVWANRLLSNWQFSPIISYHSGFWFNPSTGVDNSMTGVGNDRPDLVAQPYVRNTTTRVWLNPSAYIPNPIGTFGNVGRNSVIGPHYFDVDADVSRFFQVREHQRVELRFEFFNLGNNVNFDNPTTNLRSSNFGTILGANDPRILQFALKYYF